MAGLRARLVLPLAAVAVAVLLLARTERGAGPPAPPASAPPAADAPAPPPPEPSRGVVTGTVSDAGGEPVVGALVGVEREKEEGPRTSTDRAGRYRLEGVQPGEWLVVARACGHSNAARAEVESGDPTRVDLTLTVRPDEGLLIAIEWSERPRAFPMLRVPRPRGESWHDLPWTSGLVRIRVEEGATEVEAICPGFRSATAVLGEARPPEVAARIRMEAGGGLPREILVVDREGRPVPGAGVFLPAPESFGPAHGRTHYPRPRAAGADGRLALSARARGPNVVAFSDDGTSSATPLEGGEDPLVLRIRPAAVLTGLVRDRETGDAVPGVHVRLCAGDCACCCYWSATTDEAGRYRFRGVPAGTWACPVVFSGPGYLGPGPFLPGSRLAALESGAALVVPESGEASFADFYVTVRPTAIHRFRFPEVEPGESVRVEHLPPDRYSAFESTRTLNADRALEFELWEGPHTFRFLAAGGSGMVVLHVSGEIPVVRHEVPLTPLPRLLVRPVDREGRHVVVPNMILGGAVVRTDAGAEGRLTWNSMRVDSQGRADLSRTLLARDEPGFVNEIEASSHDARLVSEPLGISATALARLVREGDGEVEIPIVVFPESEEIAKRVSILLVDPAGRPVPGVRFENPDLPGDLDVGVETDEGGRASILPDWRPRPPWFGDWDWRFEEEDEPVRLVVEPAHRYRLRIVDAEGRPMPGLYGQVADLARSPRTGDTDEEGRTTLDLPARLGVLELESWSHHIEAVALPEGGGEVTIRAWPLRKVAVTVRGPEALAIESEIELVALREEAGRIRGADEDRAERTEDAWRGELSVPPLPLRVRARSSDVRWGATALVPAGASEIALTLERLPEHEVRLVLSDPDGRPLANRPVRVREDAFTAGVLVPGNARTGPDGSLVLRLPEGEQELVRLEVDDLRAERATFVVPAPDPVEIRLDR